MSIAPGAEIGNNYILSLVPEQELEFLRPHVEVAQLHMGEIVEEARKPVQFLYFPATHEPLQPSLPVTVTSTV